MAVENLKRLRRRVRSIKNTKQITRAMEMVSAAKLRRIQGTLYAGRPFTYKLQEYLIHLASNEEAAGHPCFKIRSEGKILVVVITADRGLCGAYNNNIIQTALNFISTRDEEIELFCIGKKGFDFFRKKDFKISGSVIDLSGRLIYDRIQDISKQVLDKYFTEGFKELYIVFSKFISSMNNKPTIELFLPLNPEAFAKEKSDKKEFHEFLLEPSSKEVFEALVPRYLQSKFFITLAESYTSEHSARMISMNTATKNCEELLTNITLKMNKARQATITKELIDIVGGSDAIVQK